MYSNIFVTISIFIKIIDCFYLEAESNYLKPKLERNNIVNKGIWIRNKLQQDMSEKANLGNFIFRENSLDADNVMNNNFDTFNDNAMQRTPLVSNYVQRARRSPEHIRKRRPRKNMKPTKIIKNSIEDSVMIKSKIVTDLKPTSVFNEYPYEVAIMLNNNYKRDENKTEIQHTNGFTAAKFENITKINNITQDVIINDISLKSNVASHIPKRSKKYDFMTETENHIHLIDEYNNTNTETEKNKLSRDIYLGDERIWNHNAPIPDSNMYKLVPKEPEKFKTVTERGLIKVISMLTKTFKKITKQHGEIKNIHDKLLNLNQDIDRRASDLLLKFEDFDSKYSDMIQFNNKLKAFESQMESQREMCELKHKGMQNTFAEFQNQQNKFLEQQKQFYGIQKLMLAQNEKINAKQNLIAKTQSEISHRQNNFARILKKAKQIFADNKSKVNNTNNENNKHFVETNNLITTPAPLSTQSMKINLFSIPIKPKLRNQDALIIKEKDEKQIDELVYKYYFNNTFIDSLMKSKILNNYATNLNSVEIVSRSNQNKNKRKLENTKMLPITDSYTEIPHTRQRRWLNHFSKNKYRRLNRHRKETTTILNAKENNKEKTGVRHNDEKTSDIKHSNIVTDPFVTMATNFCNEIGQNTNDQALKWCVEKSLRRLKFMEMNAFTPPPLAVTEMKEQSPTILIEMIKPTEATKLEPLDAHSKEPQTVTVTEASQPASTTLVPVVTPMYLVSTPGTAQTIFFPDNDELESNLKEFDLKPDTEGNVYYDGSLHISDFGRMLAGTDSEGTSDILPGLVDSNSKVEIDPRAFDLQAKRRAYVRRINENILKQMQG